MKHSETPDYSRISESEIDSRDLVEQVPNGNTYTIEDLTKRWNVSAKTILRWRERGLIALPSKSGLGNRVRFSQMDVITFEMEHSDIIHRASSFRVLSEQEKADILIEAERLLPSVCDISELVVRISNITGRSLETIRALFKKNNIRKKTVIENRFAVLQSLDLSYIPSSEFTQPDADAIILADMPVVAKQQKPRVPKDLPAYLRSLYEVPLLTPEQEVHLFRTYNYLKYKAVQLRDTKDKTQDKTLLDEIESLYVEAIETRNLIIQSNLRLVVAVAKKYVRGANDFDDKVSDGNESLCKAVEKFDYTRGFKFSTYATWAIKKNAIRIYSDKAKRQDRFRTDHEEHLVKKHDYRVDHIALLQIDEIRQHFVQQLLVAINDERDREIIVRRFGIGNWNEPKTLKEVGDELGVSKERVRQIELRAMNRLREVAASTTLDIDTLFTE